MTTKKPNYFDNLFNPPSDAKRAKTYDTWVAEHAQDPLDPPQNPQFDNNEIAPYEYSAPEAGRAAWRNRHESAKDVANMFKEVILHPIDTATGLAELGSSIASIVAPQSPLGILGRVNDPGGTQARALGRHYAERYGGWANLKKSFAEDPMGVALDASILYGGVRPLAGPVKELGKATVKGTDRLLTEARMRYTPVPPPGNVFHGGTLPPGAAPKIRSMSGGYGVHALDNPTWVANHFGGAWSFPLTSSRRPTDLSGKTAKQKAKIRKGRDESRAYYQGVDIYTDQIYVTVFDTSKAKVFHPNQPGKDVVQAVNQILKDQKALPSMKTTRFGNTFSKGEMRREIKRDLQELISGEMGVQQSFSEAQFAVLRDLGYDIAKIKHPKLQQKKYDLKSDQSSKAERVRHIAPGHTLILNKNMPVLETVNVGKNFKLGKELSPLDILKTYDTRKVPKQTNIKDFFVK